MLAGWRAGDGRERRSTRCGFVCRVLGCSAAGVGPQSPSRGPILAVQDRTGQDRMRQGRTGKKLDVQDGESAGGSGGRFASRFRRACPGWPCGHARLLLMRDMDESGSGLRCFARSDDVGGARVRHGSSSEGSTMQPDGARRGTVWAAWMRGWPAWRVLLWRASVLRASRRGSSSRIAGDRFPPAPSRFHSASVWQCPSCLSSFPSVCLSRESGWACAPGCRPPRLQSATIICGARRISGPFRRRAGPERHRQGWGRLARAVAQEHLLRAGCARGKLGHAAAATTTQLWESGSALAAGRCRPIHARCRLVGGLLRACPQPDVAPSRGSSRCSLSRSGAAHRETQ